MTTTNQTAKERAEEMARKLWSEPRTFDATVTALEKLMAENERLKADLKRHQEFTGTICLPTDVPISYANLRSQLTATEARLSEAMAFIENLSKEKRWSVEHSEMRSTRHAILAVGFLSTLTAEKKEQG